MSDASPFCFRCGYDLTGLTFPRACPECGHLVGADPWSAASVRSWFNSRAARWWWLRRPSRLPLGVWYVLDDPVSVRTARRRTLVLLWLPALLALLVVVAGNSMQMTYHTRVWYHRSDDPTRKPLRTIEEEDIDRLFHFNLRPGYDVFFRRPPDWVRVIDRTPVVLTFSRPQPDFITVGLLVLPSGFLLTAYLPGRVVGGLLARRAAKRSRHVAFRGSARPACSLVGFVAGFVVWTWLLLLIGSACSFFWPALDDVADYAIAALFLLPGAAWIMTGVVAWPRLIALDHAQVVIRGRWWLTAGLSTVAIAIPLLALVLGS
jgi:hypothetical protein